MTDKAKPSEPADLEQDTTAQRPGSAAPPVEYGGREGLEPTRYGDWEKAGRCIDF